MKKIARSLAAVVAVVMASSAFAAETETVYLTGKGKDDTVKWDFWCSAGQNANKWSTIGVPSNWELQGFGIYSYGDAKAGKVQGKYKRTFTVPANWSDKTVNLVFEGVMTDTQAFVNGQSAGPMHQGGYYRFKYDVSKLVKTGDNLLEVTVDDESANASINNAERHGDYWNYAGIFRPVYLEVVPKAHIEHVAIDAQANGTLTADVKMEGLPADGTGSIVAQVVDLQGKPVGASFQAPATALAHLSTKIASPRLWNAETPNLYKLQISYNAGNTAAVHSISQQFGFRTIEARPGAGLFVNGSRIILKGATRHCFWPESGRTLSEQLSRDDINIMKEMNMNAVRMSHYPPDQHFLDAADEMGMYILDELAGWHAKYDTPTGVRLVNEMVTRDVNHPSILFWDNGNEGGWNTALDGEFVKYDPQKRLVLHPWDPFPAGIADTKHYPNYDLFTQKLAGNAVFFPTEFLHGLYDGGAGAGLEDYWQAVMKSKVGAGGFIWSLVDEDVARVDKGGKLDSKGNAAPDGILGPHREKEGSFYAIKELWSPIVMGKEVTHAGTGGRDAISMEIENRYDFIDAKDCSFTWEVRKMHTPKDATVRSDAIATGVATLSGSIAPHTKGRLSFTVPTDLKSDTVVYVHAFAPDKREVFTFSLPNTPGMDARALAKAPGTLAVDAAETSDALTASAGDLSLQFNKKTGLLAAATRAGKTYSFINGPRFVSAAAAAGGGGRGAAAPAPAPAAPVTLTSFTHKTEGTDLLITAAFDGPMKSTTYRIHPNGWLTIDYAYNLTGPHEYFGVGFDYPEANVKAMRYLGEGPSTVYQNRLAGGTLDVWEKKYNNTMVGDPDDLAAGEKFDYPMFKGYYKGMRWLQLQTTEGPITAILNQDDLFVQVLTPKVPPAGQQGQTGVPFPKAGISFLHAIPGIGSKFSGPKSTGPQGQPAVAKGDYAGSLNLYFGEIK